MKMWQTPSAALLLLAGLTRAGSIENLALGSDLLSRSSADLEARISSMTDLYVSDEGTPRHASHPIVVRRPHKRDLVLNPDGSMNMTAWEATVNAACNDALSKLQLSSNPSGTCICYNLPLLDNSTGTFEADLRLYSLNTPSGDFAGIPPQNIQVGLSYNGASVSPVSARNAPRSLEARQSTAVNGQLRLLQSYLFVGKIDPARMTPGISQAQIEALVMPTVTLSGTNAAGQTVSTNVSSNEAAFVAGAFSKEVIMSEFSLASAAVDLIVSELGNSTVAFVLPGVQFLVFPVGLVIMSAWISIGLAFIGFGFYERVGYRESFKSRKARAGFNGTTI